ncbi:hypothetical protein ASG78_04610 [Nostocoides sp. Soil756]|jgi:hypothetical protein|nr:DUF6338 family protein [Tetrasphaera sp. Soil756]KRE62333.1 hypothetical protein ASG78_04610 [Tetrasphaera sp. Soil756]
MWPKTAQELLIALVFVVPGFVYQAVRISVRGRLPGDVDLSARVVRAIVASAIVGLAYLIVFGDGDLSSARGVGGMVQHPRVGAAFALVLGIAVPAGVALLRVPQWGWLTDRSASSGS